MALTNNFNLDTNPHLLVSGDKAIFSINVKDLQAPVETIVDGDCAGEGGIVFSSKDGKQLLHFTISTNQQDNKLLSWVRAELI